MGRYEYSKLEFIGWDLLGMHRTEDVEEAVKGAVDSGLDILSLVEPSQHE
jgi:hypothetical protein